MSAEKLEQLRGLYPNRTALLADEVALHMRGKSSRGVVQRVREGMKVGRYPGARKVDGRWQLPLETLAELLDPTPKAPVLSSTSDTFAPSRSGRRRAPIGPRLAFIRSLQFWSQVAGALGFQEDAQQLESESLQLRREGREARDRARADELLARFEADTAQPRVPVRRRPPLRP